MRAQSIEPNIDEKDSLHELVELSLLFDFYGELLGAHKRQIFEDYVLNDLSLGEIASDAGISRQGVYDIIKRCEKQLREYEKVLQLRSKFETCHKMLECIRADANDCLSRSLMIENNTTDSKKMEVESKDELVRTMIEFQKKDLESILFRTEELLKEL